MEILSIARGNADTQSHANARDQKVSGSMHLQRVYKPPVNARGKFCNEPVAQPFFDSILEIRVQQQDLDYPWSQISSYVLITQPLASFLG